MKTGIMIVAGFAIPVKCKITITDSNENNLDWYSGSYIIFYTKLKYKQCINISAVSISLFYHN